MKHPYILFLLVLFCACTSPKKQTEENQPSESTSQIDKTIQELETGKLEISNWEFQKIHDYGAGDCYGKVANYTHTGDPIILGIDSMSCGEYGDTYTFYFLDQAETLLAVYSKKIEPFFNPADESVSYLLTEKKQNFKEISAPGLIRMDTLDMRTNPIADKPFESNNSSSTESTSEEWLKAYQKLWTLQVTQ